MNIKKEIIQKETKLALVNAKISRMEKLLTKCDQLEKQINTNGRK